LRCELPSRPPGHAVGVMGPWDHLRRLAQMERLRLAPPPPPPGPPAMPGPPAAKPDGKSHPEDKRLTFDDVPAASEGWPVEDERWSDEDPLAHYAGDRCAPAPPPPPPEGDAATVTVATFAPSPRHRVEPRWSLVSELAAALPPTHPA